ncbi:hypothetical protein MMC10_000357 [Thelotrema lepadinum]|nr:hypothetical protein [Thelotrema lepadinum]
MNDTFYQKGGPIFFYDGGEAGLSDGKALGVLGGITQLHASVGLARRYHGIAILWEHRFYGESLPFEIDNMTGKALEGYEAYKYLTNEQALEDTVYFATHFQPPGHTEDLTAKSTPWIWIGGSYAGRRAAMIRQRNPDVFIASWASSAPVQSILYSTAYFNAVQEVMPRNCSADVHTAVSYADRVLAHGSEADATVVKRAIFLSGMANPASNYANTTAPDGLLYWQLGHVLAYPFFASSVTVQSFGYTQALGAFCDRLEMWNPSNFTFDMDSPSSVLVNNTDDLQPTISGVAFTYSEEVAFYAYLHASIQKGISDHAFSPGSRRSALDQWSWPWQLCSEVGQFEISNASYPTNIISSFINASSSEADCHARFSYAPPKPDIGSLSKYGGWQMKPSNVMFTNGAMDPWRSLGVQATTDINPEAPNRPSTTQVPKCNEPPLKYHVFGQVYDNAVHCQDLSKPLSVPANGTTPFDLGMALFEKALDAWLPCFQPAPA